MYSLIHIYSPYSLDSLNSINLFTYILYLDLSKAIGQVDNYVLLWKISMIGITDPLLAYIRPSLAIKTSLLELETTFLLGSGFNHGSFKGSVLLHLYMADV